jgi:alkanesulfonate monooxygenase
MDGPFAYRLIGACPSSRKAARGIDYANMVRAAGEWAERDGWEALLIYTSNGLADPWAIAQFLLQSTRTVRPLVAVQPLYEHPFTVANQVLTLSLFYQRQIWINFVAGDYPHDRAALGDQTPHDRRYDRVIEYGSIIRQLQTSPSPVTATGEFYQVKDLHLFARLPAPLLLEFTVSGSSEAGLNAARALGACAIQYPKPSHDYTGSLDPSLRSYGLRIGVIARPTSEAAWDAAHRRFPENPDGARVRSFASQVSDSVWVKELSKDVAVPAGHPYWLGPYRNYQSSCPFLVGSIDDVARELAAYLRAGFRTFLLETPSDRGDSEAITGAFRAAQDVAQRALPGTHSQ